MSDDSIKISKADYERLLQSEQYELNTRKRYKKYAQERNAKLMVMWHKGIKHGLNVTDQEVIDYIKNNK